MSRAASVVLVALAAAGCGTPSPFVPLGPLRDADVLRILAERTRARTLSAELVIAYSGPEQQGTFDAVAHLRRPGSMRLYAYKDLVLSMEPIFDLAFTPRSWSISWREDDGRQRSERGAAAEFATRHPRFAAFYWAREAFCLPGSLASDRAAIVRDVDADTAVVEGTLSSGANVRWNIARDTLEVRGAELRFPDGRSATLRYGEYVARGGVFVPGRVWYRDGDGDAETTMEAWVADVEVDPDLGAELFEPVTAKGE